MISGGRSGDYRRGAKANFKAGNRGEGGGRRKVPIRRSEEDGRMEMTARRKASSFFFISIVGSVLQHLPFFVLPIEGEYFIRELHLVTRVRFACEGGRIISLTWLDPPKTT